MFSKVTVDNFTSFDHFEFDLIENKTDKKAKKLAIIYGENGIGKTCLVKIFDFLVQSFISLVANEQLLKFINQLKSNKDNDLLLHPFFGPSLVEQRIAGYLKKYYKLNAEGNMKTSYECIIGKDKYVYTMVFSKKEIIQEKLLCNGIVLYSCSNKKLDLVDDYFLNKEFNEKLNSDFEMFFGEKHTFMACLFSERRNISLAFFKQSISKKVLAFMKMLDSITAITKDNVFDRVGLGENSFSNEFLSPLDSGDYNSKMQKKLEKTQTALSMFFSSLYSNILSLEYHLEKDPSGRERYRLYFVENNCGKTISVPFDIESTGTKKLVSLFTSLYDVSKNGKILIIDEIDNGINDILLRSILEAMEGNVCGQLIITTHNTLLLNNKIKKNIYLLDRDECKNVYAYSLDEFGRKIQPKTDIIGQYLKGLYGGVPQTGALSMKYIIEAMKEYE